MNETLLWGPLQPQGSLATDSGPSLFTVTSVFEPFYCESKAQSQHNLLLKKKTKPKTVNRIKSPRSGLHSGSLSKSAYLISCFF